MNTKIVRLPQGHLGKAYYVAFSSNKGKPVFIKNFETAPDFAPEQVKIILRQLSILGYQCEAEEYEPVNKRAI